MFLLRFVYRPPVSRVSINIAYRTHTLARTPYTFERDVYQLSPVVVVVVIKIMFGISVRVIGQAIRGGGGEAEEKKIVK